MRIPTTDAFDETDPSHSLTIEFSPKQIEWLEEQAETNDCSIEHVLRALVSAQMAPAADALPEDLEAGPGTSSASSTEKSTAASRADGSPTEAEAAAPTRPDEDESSSIVESLRTANRRLQKLTREASGDEPSGTALSRPRTRPEDGSEADTGASADPNSGDVDAPSMFDFVDE